MYMKKGSLSLMCIIVKLCTCNYSANLNTGLSFLNRVYSFVIYNTCLQMNKPLRQRSAFFCKNVAMLSVYMGVCDGVVVANGFFSCLCVLVVLMYVII